MSDFPKPQRHAVAVAAADVRREQVEWCWPGRIPLRGVSLVVGDPGLGKSLLTCALAARVSHADGVALIATAEDSLAATVRPRLEAAGADLDRVAFVEMQADDGLPTGLFLPDDTDELERLVEECGAEYLVVDPLTAHLPADVNSWRDQSVRLALAPLHALAERQRCAVVVVVHLNKALSSEPLRRIGGSVGIPAAARSVLLLARDPDDDGRRVLAHVKCNLATLAPSLLDELEPVLLPVMNGEPDVETVRLVEKGESDHQGGDLLGPSSTGDSEERGAREEAQEFLRLELAQGPRPAREIAKAARDAGIKERTLDRAKQKLRVRSEREGGIGGEGVWFWRIPEALTKDANHVVPFAEHEGGGLSRNGSTMRSREQVRPLRSPSQRDGNLRDQIGDGEPLCLICERPYTPDSPYALRCVGCRERTVA
jgi:hypothetical protein